MRVTNTVQDRAGTGAVAAIPLQATSASPPRLAISSRLASAPLACCSSSPWLNHCHASTARVGGLPGPSTRATSTADRLQAVVASSTMPRAGSRAGSTSQRRHASGRAEALQGGRLVGEAFLSQQAIDHPQHKGALFQGHRQAKPDAVPVNRRRQKRQPLPEPAPSANSSSAAVARARWGTASSSGRREASRRQRAEGQRAATMVRAISSAPPTDNSVGDEGGGQRLAPAAGRRTAPRQWAGERAAPTSSPAAGAAADEIAAIAPRPAGSVGTVAAQPFLLQRVNPCRVRLGKHRRQILRQGCRQRPALAVRQTLRIQYARIAPRRRHRPCAIAPQGRAGNWPLLWRQR